jgi:hypothetical protein
LLYRMSLMMHSSWLPVVRRGDQLVQAGAMVIVGVSYC